MARTRGICGLETGRADTGCSTVGGAAVAGTARTGTYKFQDKKTVAGGNGYLEPTIPWTVANAALFQLKLRGYFQPITFPSVANLVLASITSFEIRVEMDTTGRVRFNSSLGTAPAYTAQTVLGNWYQILLRVQGYNKLAGLDNSGRYRATLGIYDVGVDGLSPPTLLLSYDTPSQTPESMVNISCSAPENNYAIGGNALQEMASKVVGFALVMSGSTVGGSCGTANGNYTTFPAQTFARGPDGGSCTPGVCLANNGSIVESGLLNGLSISLFKISNTSITITIRIGNNINVGSTCTREINYDDIYWDFQDGVDVPADFADEFPVSTCVQPYPIVAQGFYNQFTPASNPGRVDDIPMGDASAVSSGIVTTATSYTHAVAVGNVEHVRVYARINSGGGNQSIILYSSPSDVGAVSVSIVSGTENVFADFPYEDASYLTPAAFNAIQYGTRRTTGAFDLRGLFMEALVKPHIQEEPADAFSITVGFDQDVSTTLATEITLDAAAGFDTEFAPYFESDLALSTGVLGFVLGNQGVDINVPVTWHVNRIDVGYRGEEGS